MTLVYLNIAHEQINNGRNILALHVYMSDVYYQLLWYFVDFVIPLDLT